MHRDKGVLRKKSAARMHASTEDCHIPVILIVWRHGQGQALHSGINEWQPV